MLQLIEHSRRAYDGPHEAADSAGDSRHTGLSGKRSVPITNIPIEILTSVVGSPAVKPLIFADAPARLLDLISATKDVPAASRLLPHILRALRNILVATADVTWGHLRGVVVPQKIVKTGLEDADDTSESPVPRSPKGKEVVGRDWKTEARQALGLVFEVRIDIARGRLSDMRCRLITWTI